MSNNDKGNAVDNLNTMLSQLSVESNINNHFTLLTYRLHLTCQQTRIQR